MLAKHILLESGHYHFNLGQQLKTKDLYRLKKEELEKWETQ